MKDTPTGCPSAGSRAASWFSASASSNQTVPSSVWRAYFSGPRAWTVPSSVSDSCGFQIFVPPSAGLADLPKGLDPVRRRPVERADQASDHQHSPVRQRGCAMPSGSCSYACRRPVSRVRLRSRRLRPMPRLRVDHQTGYEQSEASGHQGFGHRRAERISVALSTRTSSAPWTSRSSSARCRATLPCLRPCTSDTFRLPTGHAPWTAASWHG